MMFKRSHEYIICIFIINEQSRFRFFDINGVFLISSYFIAHYLSYLIMYSVYYCTTRGYIRKMYDNMIMCSMSIITAIVVYLSLPIRDVIKPKVARRHVGKTWVRHLFTLCFAKQVGQKRLVPLLRPICL